LDFYVYFSDICATEVGPYQASDPNNRVYDHEYNLYTLDPQAELTEIYYCDINTGTDWQVIRGFKATFTNPHTGFSEIYQYGDLDTPTFYWIVDCYTVAISTTVVEYNVQLDDEGITGFSFRDVSGNVYAPCVRDNTCDTVYTDYQQLSGPIQGFHVHTRDKSDPGLMNLPIDISIVQNSCPCPLTTFTGGIEPSEMAARVLGSGDITQTLLYQANIMEEYFGSAACGSYSVELTPALDFLTISKSGAMGPDGVT
jgi:hypothetical protein